MRSPGNTWASRSPSSPTHGTPPTRVPCTSAAPPASACRRRRPHHQLVFTDRVLVTLVVLRFQLPHQALAVLYGVHRATIPRAIHEVGPLLAKPGFAVPGMPGVRLRTLADVSAYAAAQGVQLRLDGTETQVRRRRVNRPGRRRLSQARKSREHHQGHHRLRRPGSDAVGRGGAARADTRPGRDQARRDRGLAAATRRRPRHGRCRLPGPGQGIWRSVHAPLPKPAKDAPPQELAAWRQARKQQSSQRICVEHAIAEHKQWRALQRWTGRRGVPRPDPPGHRRASLRPGGRR
jgi:Helix-turn-helix of DDE superfamily endonuclease